VRLGTIRKSDAVDSVRLAVISNCILCRLEIVVATIGATSLRGADDTLKVPKWEEVRPEDKAAVTSKLREGTD
jgi:hypothetical protein